MNVIKPVENRPATVFLAGSIEMNKAENWQDKVSNYFNDRNVVFYNPRRSDWDSSWEQSANDDNFAEQVKWEVSHIDSSDIVYFYIDPTTKSPITLWEIGYTLKTPRRIIMCCPDGYWRRGNLEVYSKIFNFPLTNNFEISLKWLGERL